MKKITLLAEQGNPVGFKRWYAVLLLPIFLLLANTSLAQVNNYTFTQTAGSYTPITGGTVLWTGYDAFDSESTTVTLPVSFTYQGVIYNSVYVNVNGYVLFGSTTATNTPISSGRNAVSAFAADLDAKSASSGAGVPEVRWEQVANEFVVQWANVCRYTSSGATSAENLNFQIRLDTATGIVKIVYGACVDRVTPSTTYPQVGLGGGSTTVYSNRTIAAGGGDWINSTAGTANGNTMAFNGATVPSNGLTFTWTPPTCVIPVGLTAGNLTLNSATISWTASVSTPANGYEYEVRTSGAAGSGATGLVASGTTNGLNAAISGLTANTTYSFYVRANCGSGDFSVWNTATFLTGYCVPSSTSSSTYINNFSTTGGSTNISNLASGYTATGYQNNYDSATVSQYATGIVNFASDIVGGTAGTSIWVDWNKDLIFDNATERVFVTTSYGNNQIGSFTVPNGTPLGDYRMRIRVDYNAIAPDACSNVNTRTEAEDYKFTVIAPPACLPPTGLTAVANTAFTATLNWVVSISNPQEGYQYYISENNTPPTAGSTETGSVGAGLTTASVTTGLAPSTTYYVWIRSNCGSGLLSDWSLTPVSFRTPCNLPSITGTTPDSICGQGSATLEATSSAGDVKWYAAATGGVPLHTGNTFTTPVISATTTYYVAANEGGATQTSSNGIPNFTTSTQNSGVIFNLNTNVTINSIQVYSTAAGTATVTLLDSSLTVLYTSPALPIVAGTLSTPQTLTLGWPVPAGNGYRILVSNTGNALGYSTGVFPAPMGNGVGSIVNGATATGTTTLNYFVYNISTTSGCESPTRVPVVATVSAAPALTLNGTSAEICSGDMTSAVTLTSNASDYDTYVWQPSTGVSGDANTGWIFNPTVTTAYTLTASQSSGAECLATALFTVNVNPLPSAITIVAPGQEVCENSIVELSVSGNTVNSTAVFGTGTTAPGTTSWPNPFSAWYGGTKHQMLYTASELTAQGLEAGSLISAVTFDIAAFAPNACTDFTIRMGTTSVTQMTGLVSGTTTVYGPLTFTPSATGIVTFTLSTPYVWDGSSNLIVETVHNAGNGGNGAGTTTKTSTTLNNSVYRVAKDNVAGGIAGFDSTTFTVMGAHNIRPNMTFVYSSSQNLITWSPVTNLYTNEEATAAYVADSYATTVYFKPSASGSVTYTATSNTVEGCAVNATIDLTVNETPDAPVAASPQTLDEGQTLADLAVTGTGLIWYSDSGLTTIIPNTTVAVDGTTYYVTQTVGDCTSAATAILVQVTLGNDSFDLAGLKLYPNPVNSLLNVDYTDTITIIEVFNIVGQKVTSKNVNALSTTVDMSNMAAGTYFVKVQAANAARTIKVVKN